MANTFITPSVVARRGIATLYNQLTFAALVWQDFATEFRGQKVGDTINIRKPGTFTAVDFDTSARTTTWQEVTETSVPLVLDTLSHVPFYVTDEEMTLEISDFQAQLLDPAMEALAQKIDGAVAEKLIDVAEAGGGGGTISKSSDPATTDRASWVFNKAREQLSRAKAPSSERYGVLSPEAATDFLGEELLVAVDKSGSSDALRNAVIGRLYGIETYESNGLGVGPGDRGQADGVAFHRQAITLAARPLEQPRGVPNGEYSLENFKGLSLRVIYSYDHAAKSDKVTVDILYGMAATRPDLAIQLNLGIGS